MIFQELNKHYGGKKNKKKGQPESRVTYPVLFSYINKIQNWWPPQKILADIGVPDYAKYHIYNHFAFAFWTFNHGPLDAALLWSDPMKYFGEENPFGNNKKEVQKYLKSLYNKEGIKILVSAFGSTELPTTQGIDPASCAQKLGQFVLQNNLDGVDIDYEDTAAFEASTAQPWLKTFTVKLRQMLPNHIISHAPQAPYFSPKRYKGGGYDRVDEQVGDLIDFYNVQFYNQGKNAYDTYDTLFLQSGGYFPGTAVKQISARGVPLNKIIVGKPATPSDATNTGHTNENILAMALNRGFRDGFWSGGLMLWQYSSDVKGLHIMGIAGYLKLLCEGKAY